MIDAAREAVFIGTPGCAALASCASVIALGAALEANASVGPVCELTLPAFSPLRPTPGVHRDAKRNSMASKGR